MGGGGEHPLSREPSRLDGRQLRPARDSRRSFCPIQCAATRGRPTDSGSRSFASQDGVTGARRPGGHRRAARLLPTARPGIATGRIGLPDGATIAYVERVGGNDDIYLVRVDGAGLRNLTRSAESETAPVWSPDSSRVAFLAPSPDGAWTVQLINVDGSGRRQLSSRTVVRNDYVGEPGFAWSPDGRSLVFASETGIYLVPADGGSERRLSGDGRSPRFSPDGAMIAFIAGRECGQDWGIYLAKTTGTLPARRLTNGCTIRGTSAADTISGRPRRDVVFALGGNDTIHTWNPKEPDFFIPDLVRAGPGNDLVDTGWGPDELYGGRGNDKLVAGPGADRLFGGPGRDLLVGGPGSDKIIARDGWRDIVRCGSQRDPASDRDVVIADRLDQVASDCETITRA